MLYLVYSNHDKENNNLSIIIGRLRHAADRAFRNCPYSLELSQLKMKVALEVANVGQEVLDPDSLLRIVKEVMDAKFLLSPLLQAHLQLYLAAIRTVKRRILTILANAAADDGKAIQYDDAEHTFSESTVNSTNFTLKDAAEEEVQDLAEDLR
jgi:hypothetical protein